MRHCAFNNRTLKLEQILEEYLDMNEISFHPTTPPPALKSKLDRKMKFVCVGGRDRLSCGAEGGGGAESRAESKAESGELFLYSPLKVIFFVALMCGMLVLMYFFYNVLGG